MVGQYLATLTEGHIQADTAARRQSVIDQATALAGAAGGTIDVEANSALIDEITNLVEDPHGVLGSFDERYLQLPDRILTSVMAKHQRYLPLRAADGSLMAKFVTMANGTCDDAVVSAGNESVLRARYEDALFFWNADLEQESVEAFVPGLEKLTFENRLGSVGQRARRIGDVANTLGQAVGLDGDMSATLSRAGSLAKYDLATNLVTEMTSLAGFVAREYAVRKGETQAVADALYEMEQPHTTADAVPASVPGALLALGDRADLLAAMFALGAKPSGSSDPYGLRRAALGLVRILRERGADLPGLTVHSVLAAASERLREQGIDATDESTAAAHEFVLGRFAQLQRDEGLSADVVAAVSVSADVPVTADANAKALVSLVGDKTFKDLVEMVVRIDRIVPDGTVPSYDAAALSEPAEVALHEAMQGVEPSTSLTDFASRAGVLVDPIHRFFDETLVMAEDPAVRAARLGLLSSVLALAPSGLAWASVDSAIA